jgi:hypothetical protein
MSSMTSKDKVIIEKLFGMSTGYVLDFSNRTFQSFIMEVTGKDIYDTKYAVHGESKANRLRAFWTAEPDYITGVLLDAMLDHLSTRCLLVGTELDASEAKLAEICKRVAERLRAVVSEEDLSAIRPIGPQREFDVLTKAIHDAISNNQPEAAIDRLHTYTIKYMRTRCSVRGVPVDKDKPLHSLFGEYLKALRVSSVALTTMAERILKSSISVLEAFNDIRNDRTLAHDNPLLETSESLFILKAICNLVYFLDEIDPMAEALSTVPS